MNLEHNAFFYLWIRFAVLLFTAGGFLAFLTGCAAPSKIPEGGPQNVTFTYQGGYRSVCLSGDFNGWATDSHCLRPNGQTWKIELLLSPGRYRYGFILDGSRWVTDPQVLLIEEDGFGRKNSVLVVDWPVTPPGGRTYIH